MKTSILRIPLLALALVWAGLAATPKAGATEAYLSQIGWWDDCIYEWVEYGHWELVYHDEGENWEWVVDYYDYVPIWCDYWYQYLLEITGITPGCSYTATVETQWGGTQEFSGTAGSGGSLYYFFDLSATFDGEITGISVAEACPYVTEITGLPDVVCAGETYDVTAQSSGGTLSALQWGGAATVLSQFGQNATVQFNTPGNDLIMWAQNNTQANPPQAQASTSAVTVTYSIPARGGNSSLPVSIPYNGQVDVTVILSDDIGSKQIKFRINGGSSNTGQATIVAPSNARLSGTGGTLTIKGTAQTNPGYAGNLQLSTDTKPFSQCSPSPGFSVCAHPQTISKAFDILRVNAVLLELGFGRWWGACYRGTYYDENGATGGGIFSGVSLSEDVTAGSHTGLWSNFSPYTSGWRGVNSSGDDDNYTVGGPNGSGGYWDTASLNQFVVNGNYAGSATDYQFYKFTCARCGMCSLDVNGRPIEGDPTHPLVSHIVSNSRFKITQWYTTDGTNNCVVTSVLPETGGSPGSGQVADTSDRTTPLTN